MTPSDAPDPGRVVDARPGATPPAPAPRASAEPPAPEPTAPRPEADPADAGTDTADQGPAPTAAVPPAADAPAATGEAGSEDPLEEAAEVVETDLAALAGERDTYLDQLRRLQADFENYRKRVTKQQDEVAERAAEALVADLLPVLDACDAAAQHGDEAVAPVARALVDVLAKRGLERVAPDGEAFDPNQHEAVAHEPAEGDGGPTVAEVLRAGYVWNGRVLRPAMVRVKG